MLQKRLQRNLEVTAGLQLDRGDITDLIANKANGAIFNYEREASVAIRSLATKAETVGKLACNNEEDCRLSCSGVPLLNTVSDVDADFTSRCKSQDCDGSGIKAATAGLQAELTQDQTNTPSK
jgi:hypothetical protein